MAITPTAIDVAKQFGPPVVVAAISFYCAWFRTRKKLLFSDAHGSRWDVAGLALACLVGCATVIGWRDLLPPAGLGWLPLGLGAILLYLVVAAAFRFREATDSVVICLASLVTLVMTLRGVEWFVWPETAPLVRVQAITTIVVVTFVVATCQSFLTWRLEAFDFFLINTFQAIPAVWFCSLSLQSGMGAQTISLAALVLAVGLLLTMARRRLQLTLAFGLLYGFFVCTVASFIYFSADGPTQAPRPTAALVLFAASLVVPAVLAAFPAIAENRKRSRIILPSVAVILATAAIAARHLPAGTG